METAVATPTAVDTGASGADAGAADTQASSEATMNALVESEVQERDRATDDARAEGDAATETKTPPPDPNAAADAAMHKVKVDGQEVEVSLAELKKGYMRNGFFTKQLQELRAAESKIERLEAALPAAVERRPADLLVKIGGAKAAERAILDMHGHRDPEVRAAFDRALDKIVADSKRPQAEIELERIQRAREELEADRRAIQEQQEQAQRANAVKGETAALRKVLESALTDAKIKISERTLAEMSRIYGRLHRPGHGWSAELAAEAATTLRDELADLAREASPPAAAPPARTTAAEVQRVAAAKSAPPNTTQRDASGRFTTAEAPRLSLEQLQEQLAAERRRGR
jgi:hypothetical protein